MPNVKTLAEMGYDPSAESLRNLVGRRLHLHLVHRMPSRRYGDGMDFIADVLDADTGEVIERERRVTSFGKAVIRVGEYLLGDPAISQVVLDPPVAVTVVKDGDVIALV